MNKVVAFDLEIVKEIPEGVKDWRQVRPLGISCAALLDANEPLSILYYHGDVENTPKNGAMTKDELEDLVLSMVSWMKSGYKIITWNGLGFDFNVLAEESGMYDQCKELALNHIDMMFHFFCVKGYMLGLDTAATGLGLGGKMAGMSGELAPRLWESPKLKDRLKVLRYVHQDVVSTLEVYEESTERRAVNWVSRSGRQNTFWLPKTGWKTVTECLKLPLPDQSWMSEPTSRESMMEWIK